MNVGTEEDPAYIAVYEHKLVAQGSQEAVAAALLARYELGQAQSVPVFERQTGRQVDVDFVGVNAASQPPPRPRGRPKLGVIGREVTLLPRHWRWLEAQRGGASAVLRRLVDAASQASVSADKQQAAQDRGNRFLTATAGDLPGFEEAIRALYAADAQAFAQHIAQWPKDMAALAQELTADAFV